VAFTAYEYEAMSVGVPDKTPEELKESVLGRSLFTNEYVTSPPDATKEYKNG
jgi:hypothetical protein